MSPSSQGWDNDANSDAAANAYKDDEDDADEHSAYCGDEHDDDENHLGGPLLAAPHL